MGRKATSRAPASSAAAAAASPTTPAFTSFAAATAQALGAPTLAPVSHETTPWDTQALSLLKKLSKRDSTTKLRALSDLSAHLGALGDDLGPGVGAHFVTAWGAAFRPALLQEEVPAVRAALLSVMAEVVVTFRKLVQYVFADVLPVWVAARGDLSAAVAGTAVKSLDGVLTTEIQKAKVVQRYGEELRKFCNERMGVLEGEGDKERFLVEARRVVAVLTWLVEVAKGCAVVEEVIDVKEEPLFVMAKGGKRKGKEGWRGAMGEVCEFAVVALHWMDVGADKDRERARRFLQLALLGVRRGESAAWDLILVLLRGGWHDVIDWCKLGETISEAITATFPAGLQALLPVLDALPEGSEESARLAEHMLERMKAALHPTENKGGQPGRGNSIYVFSALPSYIECASFVYSSGAKRWLEGTEACGKYVDAVITGHIVPTVALFLAGELPPVPKTQHQIANSGAHKSYGGRNVRVTRGVAQALAQSVQGMTKEQWNLSVQDLARAFLNNVEGSVSEVMFRYELVLDCLKEENFATWLLDAVVRGIVDPESKLVSDVGLTALSLSLSKSASCNVLQQSVYDAKLLESLVGALLNFVNQIVVQLKDGMGSDTAREAVKEVADVYSWVYWALSSKNQQVKQDIVADIERLVQGGERWYLLGEVLQAHERRKDLEAFIPWNIIQSNHLEEHIRDAAESLQGNENTVHALHLISAALQSEGGADIPLPVLRKIAQAVTSRIMTDGNDSSCDEIIAALLRCSVQHLENEDTFNKLLAWTVLRAAMSETLLLQTVALLDRLTAKKAVLHVEGMLGVIRGRESFPENINNPYTSRRARAVAMLISHLHSEMSLDCVALCESILSWCSTSFANEFLCNIPLGAAFGDGVAFPLCHDRVLDVFEIVGRPKEHHDISSLLYDFLVSLDAEDKGILARLSAKRFLAGSYRSLADVLKIVCHDLPLEGPANSMAFRLIANVVMDSIPSLKATSHVAGFERVPMLMTMLVSESHGRCLEGFQYVFDNILRVIRSNPLAKNAGTALDIISASLIGLSTGSSSEGAISGIGSPPQWLKDAVSVALMSARKSLERPLSASSEEIHNLETHSSFLMSHAVKAIEMEGIEEAEFRFWAIRTNNIFQTYVEQTLDKGKITPNIARRMSSLATLGSTLIDFDASTKLLQSNPIQELCHYGAWTSVGLLPVMEKTSNDDKVNQHTLNITAEGACNLVLKAAEKGVLVGPDGQIPVDAELVYELAPLLSSPTPSTRKAVLALLVFTATIELPKIVCDAFSREGFGDEAEELAFVTGLIPEPLRKALEWPMTLSGGAGSEARDDAAALELGYFLSWRLFLDLIQSDNPVPSGVVLGDVGEDFSFRRVGTTYLRSQPDLYATFFEKCVEVVIDGNPRERIEAGVAAAEALEAEERVAQGVQLVKQQIDNKEKQEGQNSDEHDPGDDRAPDSSMELIDKEVGRAAGIAFARALQRLPALSRQHVTDKLDRGTVLRVEEFVRKKISPLLIAAEIRKVKEWGAFGGGPSANRGESSANESSEGELHARGSVAGRLVWATYTFSDVTLEIGMRLPDVFPLQIVEVEARSRIGMSESRWRKTLLGMTTLLRAKDGTLAEAVELWRRNLDKTFQGAEECPICYSVLHLATAALPRMQCRTCKNLFHSECLCKWFTKSNSSACPLCRSAF